MAGESDAAKVEPEVATDLVIVERRGVAALLTLNRPKAMNALDAETLEALAAAVEEVRRSDARALVLTGEGRAFAAGADIEAMGKMSPLEAAEFSRLGHSSFAALESLEIPTIAAVNGFALGGGCELALACDWIYASTKARFGQPEVKLGLIPGFGGTSRLTRRVGLAWAKEMVLTADTLSAEDALRIGLANRVFEADELLNAALKTAEQIGGLGPVAVSSVKRVLQQAQDADVDVAHALEQNAFGLVFASADRDEGIAAFLEKREPEFEER
jgi:enoyl-CoA hydratase